MVSRRYVHTCKEAILVANFDSVAMESIDHLELARREIGEAEEGVELGAADVVDEADEAPDPHEGVLVRGGGIGRTSSSSWKEQRKGRWLVKAIGGGRNL